jgi:hypothetical protein
VTRDGVLAVVAGPRPPLLHVPAAPGKAGSAPLSACLSRLGSAESRRVMRSSLDTIARAVSQGACDAEGFPWHLLRYQHTSAIRAWLSERASPATCVEATCL